ncbi:MAG: DUF2304 domain-containing protein [Lachnospiraceae bacterium]|nr:DUF2304 domain-containing protein [Lachnospiraceae bacterium]
MSVHLQVMLVVAVVVYFCLLIHFIKKKTLALKYALLWMVAGAGVGIMVIFPGVLDVIAGFFGINSPVNALFFIGIFFIVLILLSLTAIVSKQTERIKKLAQENAMLEKRMREKEGTEQE